MDVKSLASDPFVRGCAAGAVAAALLVKVKQVLQFRAAAAAGPVSAADASPGSKPKGACWHVCCSVLTFLRTVARLLKCVLSLSPCVHLISCHNCYILISLPALRDSLSAG